MGRAKLSPGALARFLRFLLHQEEWNIGVIAQTAEAIVQHGVQVPIRWLPAPPRRTMFADPGCLIAGDGSLSLFAEYLDYRTNRGEIWSADIPAGADPANAVLAPLLAMPTHMSYPYPFRDDAGRDLMTAETWQAGGALLWERANGGWQPRGELFPGRSVVDPTLWRSLDGWWLFCGFQDDLPNERLHIFHTPRIGDPWTPHEGNPVKQVRGGSRCAGPIFVAGGTLVRPAQDCTTTYGAAVVLHAIRRLDLRHFVEEPIRRIAPCPGPYPDGLHTFCPAGAVTFVDGKRLRLDPAGTLSRLQARFKVS